MKYLTFFFFNRKNKQALQWFQEKKKKKPYPQYQFKANSFHSLDGNITNRRPEVVNRGGREPNWAGFICFLQPALQWTDLKIEIRNLCSEWPIWWAMGSTDRGRVMRVWVLCFLFFFFKLKIKIKIWAQN